MNIENQINRLLLDTEMTQTELAQKLGVHRTLLCGVINRKKKSNPVKYKIAKYFGLPVNELFPDDAA